MADNADILPQDRYFGPDARQAQIAEHLYELVAGLPLVCPHGHVDPRMFADPDYDFGTPVDLLIIPDHYVPACFTPRAFRSRRWGCRGLTAVRLRPTTARSGRPSPTTSTCSAAPRAACG